jgi:hypothetical protein
VLINLTLAQRQPAVGRAPHPWRDAQAWLRSRSVHGFQIYDPAPWTTLAGLADIPVQQCRSHCGDRSMRGAHANIRASVGGSSCGLRSPGIRQLNGWPSSLWRHFLGIRHRRTWCATMTEPNAGDGHSGSTNCAEIALAVRGTTIKRARIWHWTRASRASRAELRADQRDADPVRIASLLTLGFDFRKGQLLFCPALRPHQSPGVSLILRMSWRSSRSVLGRPTCPRDFQRQ